MISLFLHNFLFFYAQVSILYAKTLLFKNIFFNTFTFFIIFRKISKGDTMYDYTKLNSLLNYRHLTKQDLNKTLSISSKTLAKINKNEKYPI